MNFSHSDENEFNNSNGSSVYVKASYKYNDTKSSATVLLLVGTIGIAIIIMDLLKIVSIPIYPKWLFYVSMGLVFVIFIIIGIYSLISAKKLKAASAAEDSLHDSIIDWAKTNLSKEIISTDLDNTLNEELLYFERTKVINDMIAKNFDISDSNFSDAICEEIYELFF